MKCHEPQKEFEQNPCSIRNRVHVEGPAEKSGWKPGCVQTGEQDVTGRSMCA